MIFSKLFLLAALLTFSGGCRLAKEDGFPYGPSSADVQIALKHRNSNAAQRSVYLIKAGDIDGEAILDYALTAEAGRSMVHSQMAGIKSSFENMRAPYGGQITSRIDCNAQKYMKEQTVPFAGMETRLILAVAGGRRIFGICTIEQVQYASAFWSAYDEKRELVLTIKLFKPVADPKEIDQAQQQVLQTFWKVISPSTEL